MGHSIQHQRLGGGIEPKIPGLQGEKADRRHGAGNYYRGMLQDNSVEKYRCN